MEYIYMKGKEWYLLYFLNWQFVHMHSVRVFQKQRHINFEELTTPYMVSS